MLAGLRSVLARASVETRKNCLGIGLGAGVGVNYYAWPCISGHGFRSTFNEQSHDSSKKLRIVVIGGGIMGASTAYSMSKRGHIVTVVGAADPFRSSWGETRIARLSQETPLMLSLMKQARVLWSQLEEEIGAILLKQVGTLDIGLPEELKDVIDTFESDGIPFERLSAGDLAKRWPQVGLADGMIAVYQKDGWVMLTARCLEALTDRAEKNGARVLTGESLVSCDTSKRVVTTDEGRQFHYDRLVLCCGPWSNQALKMCGLAQLPLVVSIEQQSYFEAFPGQESLHTWDSLPIILSGDRGPGGDIYAIPHVIGGVNGMKVSVHREGPVIDNEEHPIPPGTVIKVPNLNLDHNSRPLSEKPHDCDQWMEKAVKRWVKRHLPKLRPEIVHHYRCPYTGVASDDGGFVVGPYPNREDVFLACSFHGEGFKFATAIGEMIADMALSVPVHVPEAVKPFSPVRLVSSPQATNVG